MNLRTKISRTTRTVSALSLACVALLSSSQQLTAQAAAPAAASEPQSKLQFDVISIRRNTTGDPDDVNNRGNINVPTGAEDTFRNTGGVFRATNIAVRLLIAFAYKTSNGQGDAFRASLPDWALTEGYDIEARTENQNVTKDQMREMMKSLLADRFQLKAHHEDRQTPVYAVVLVKPVTLGPNLRPHPANEPCSNIAPPAHPNPDAPPPPPPPAVLPGYPVTCGGFANMTPTVPGLRHEASRNMPIATIITSFTGLGRLGRPVIDGTGLTGNFDWFIEFKQENPDGSENPDISGPSFQEALKNQLGLKLDAQKATADYFLVDHIERPSGN